MATQNNLFGAPYYHEIIKKTIIGFGSLFSNIQVLRRDSNGVVAETLRVPIAYSPREKTLARQESDPNLDQGFFASIPRMGFEITSYSFNAAEMTNRNNKIQHAKPDGTSFAYTPVPYDVQIQLHALTKGTEDGLAIVEQILPLFTPEYNLPVQLIPEMNLLVNFPIILNGVSVADDFEGDFLTRRLVTHTFDFTAKVKLIGPIRRPGIILRTEVDVETPGVSRHISVGDKDTRNIIVDEWVYSNETGGEIR